MPKKTKQSTDNAKPLCILHETDEFRAELHREGEGFRVQFPGTKRKDRGFDSLPSLLSGLQGIFLEIRMSGPGLHGLDALAKASGCPIRDAGGSVEVGELIEM